MLGRAVPSSPAPRRPRAPASRSRTIKLALGRARNRITIWDVVFHNRACRPVVRPLLIRRNLRKHFKCRGGLVLPASLFIILSGAYDETYLKWGIRDGWARRRLLAALIVLRSTECCAVTVRGFSMD